MPLDKPSPILSDNHLHTRRSFDGQMDMAAACRAAVDGGLASVCFTEHFSVLDHDPSYRYLDQAAYLADWESCTRQYAGRLEIGLGLEIGEPHRHPREIAAACSGLPLDFVIGSIHNIGREKLRMYQSRHGAQAAYAAYFTAVLAMAEAGDIDVIGHLDLMKRYAGENYRYQDYAPLIDRILQTAVRRGIGLEINASNLDATGGAAPGEFFPGDPVLARYRELGGEIITFGSDAHRPEAVGRHAEAAAERLRCLGFRRWCRFRGRRPEFFSLYHEDTQRLQKCVGAPARELPLSDSIFV